jgi:hypothetical protein
MTYTTETTKNDLQETGRRRYLDISRPHRHSRARR